MRAIVLNNPGDRNKDRMTKEAAEKVVERWKHELEQQNDGPWFVETLDLQCLVYEPEGAQVICDYLRDKVSHVRVVLLNDIIATLETTDGLDVLTQFNNLLKDSPLEQVNLDDNALGTRGVTQCAGILSRPTLTKLSLQNVGLPAESMIDLKVALTNETDGNTSVCDHLQEAWFYNNMSGEGGAKEQAEIIGRCRALKFWKYVGCRAGEQGTQYLAEGLLRMTNHWNGLQQLLLEASLGSTEKNPLGDFCRALKKLPSLTHIMLYDCSLEHSGTKLVLKSLRHIKNQLVSLSLSQNEMTALTMKTLVPFVVQNGNSLKILNLENNELTSVGLERLLEGIRNSTEKVVLEELLLTDNRIGSRGATALLAARDFMPHLKLLTLDDNGIPDDLLDQLRDLYGNALAPFSDDYAFDYDFDDEIEDDNDDDDDDDVDAEEEGEVEDDAAVELDVTTKPMVVVEANAKNGLDDLIQGMGKVKLTPDDVSL